MNLQPIFFLTSSNVSDGIHEQAFQVMFCLLRLVSVPVLDCKKYSQISDGLNAFVSYKVDIFLEG